MTKRINLLLSVLVSQCAWDPLSTHVVGAGMRGKLEHGSLGENTGGNNLEKKRALVSNNNFKNKKHDQIDVDRNNALTRTSFLFFSWIAAMILAATMVFSHVLAKSR